MNLPMWFNIHSFNTIANWAVAAIEKSLNFLVYSQLNNSYANKKG